MSWWWPHQVQDSSQDPAHGAHLLRGEANHSHRLLHRPVARCVICAGLRPQGWREGPGPPHLPSLVPSWASPSPTHVTLGTLLSVAVGARVPAEVQRGQECCRGTQQQLWGRKVSAPVPFVCPHLILPNLSHPPPFHLTYPILSHPPHFICLSIHPSHSISSYLSQSHPTHPVPSQPISSIYPSMHPILSHLIFPNPIPPILFHPNPSHRRLINPNPIASFPCHLSCPHSIPRIPFQCSHQIHPAPNL